MTPVWVLDADAKETGSLGQHLGSERLGTRNGSGPHPFGRTTVFAAAGDAIYLGSGEGFEVRRYTHDGTLTRIQRVLGVDLTIPNSMISAYRADRLANVREDRRPAVERELLETPMPSQLPAFTALLVDEEDHLWARRFSGPGDERERWGIFTPAGALLGHIAMPDRFDLLEAGGDYVLGLARDADGVERIRLYALRRR
jgi:hypothetical protein